MTGPIHVLLVEDSPGDALLVRGMLHDTPSEPLFHIEDAATMASALEKLAERDFDVVLLDLSLPDSRGLSTVAQIRRARPALPIVVLTGIADEEMAVRAVQGGAQDYLVKGQGNSDIIRRAIRHALERLRFEHALRSSEAELRAIFEGSAVGIALADGTGALLKINPALQRLLGSSDPERCAIHDFAAACACREGEICTTELQLVRPDGASRWVKVTVSPAHGGPHDAPVRVVMTEDFTARRDMEERLRLSARVLESTSEGVFVTDARQRIVHVNPAFTQLTGYALDEVIGRKPSLLASGRHGPEFYAIMDHALQQTGNWQGEIWNRKKSGALFAEWLNISVVRDDDGHIAHYVAVFSDITSRKQNEERLNYQANHDPLTNLPNRTLFHERLNRALARAGRTRQTVALLFIDLDHFKEVNDSRGHLVGDMLLQAVAERLTASTRQGDTVARLAGDEFTVILEDITDFRDAAVVAQKVVRRLAEPFELGGQRLSVTTSLGIALFPSDSTDGQCLLHKADAAMYRAKKQGRNGYQFHDETLNAQAFERLALESSLRHALERDELALHYQPIYEIATGRVVAAEALLRWSHPEAGLVLPGQFLHAASEAGLMLPIGRWVLTAACRQLAAWKEAGLDIRLSINLAHQQLHQFDLIETIHATLRQTGADPGRLEIELAESALFGTPRAQEALPVLQKLRGLGVRIAVDDFGTGYSSFGQLRRLPIDSLKIDQAFVRDIGTEADDARIITAIVAIAHSLRLGVVAEGVETSEQLAFLRRQNCDMAQGFLFSRPMPITEFDQLVAKPAAQPA